MIILKEYKGKRKSPGKKLSNAYRYGFNGQEKDDEVKGQGNSYDFEFRIQDPRLGKFLSPDPLFRKYPYYTPYQFGANNPILAVDVEGLESANDKNPTATGTTGGSNSNSGASGATGSVGVSGKDFTPDAAKPYADYINNNSFHFVPNPNYNSNTTGAKYIAATAPLVLGSEETPGAQLIGLALGVTTLGVALYEAQTNPPNFLMPNVKFNPNNTANPWGVSSTAPPNLSTYIEAQPPKPPFDGKNGRGWDPKLPGWAKAVIWGGSSAIVAYKTYNAYKAGNGQEPAPPAPKPTPTINTIAPSVPFTDQINGVKR